MRIGIGYDVHALTDQRKLIIGGVDIPHDKGLLGHSDADVLVHAIMDALLGAAGEADIGTFFPDTDPAYKDISSLTLLARVANIIEERQMEIGNIDSVIIAQAPKMLPHIPAMRENIARTLKIGPEQIGIKATTTEWLGFTGRKEGIAAQAVATLCIAKK
ncbi:MAG: 2-C-methyl-D-erythritol 2,4-cyclodiphosphate synthase [Tissierellia bacterium]|nr:2-C-methyl-D-erythritol 2,4-cyclodiphosphate synthase [Bacillota bacterium]NLK58134.1 2-C-methyl-D-erythritol 2,4-cyclodiphosphate synthase [Tissierellia bacterium]